MKRCPECDFIYLDTDDVCDLDGTPLIHADESDLALAEPIAESTAAAPASHSRRPLIAALIIGLSCVVVVAGLYLAIIRSRVISPVDPVVTPTTPSPLPSPVTQTSPTSIASVSPQGSPSPTTKSPDPIASPSRAVISRSPVSTSANGASQSSRVYIRLVNGARIEADEVWRAKEGFWYRRNGIVTLIKSNQVKAIERGAP